LGTVGLDRFNTVKNGLAMDQHTGTTAIRLVVYRFPLVGRPVPKIPQLDIHQTAFDRQLQQALAEVALEDFRKNCQHVEPHDSDPNSLSVYGIAQIYAKAHTKSDAEN